MKPALTKSLLALFAFAVLAAIAVAEEQSRNVLGKIDHQALLEAAPGIPATTTEASKRTYGTEINANADTAARATTPQASSCGGPRLRILYLGMLPCFS